MRTLLRLLGIFLLGAALPAIILAHVGAAIAVDRDGRIYFVDTTRDRLWRVERNGNLTLVEEGVHTDVVTVGADGTARLPEDTVFSVAGPDRSLYRAHGNRIMRLHPDQWLTVFAGDTVAGFRDGAAKEARFDHVLGLAADSAGNVYVADYGNRRVRRVGARGDVTTVVIPPWPWRPTGVAVWQDRVYVLERWGDYYSGATQLAMRVPLFADVVGHPRVRVLLPDGSTFVAAAVVGWWSRIVVALLITAALVALYRRMGRRRRLWTLGG